MPKIAVFDSKGNLIGAEDRHTVYEKGLWHGLVRILLYNSKGDLLCQLRSKDEDTFPNTYDQSAGGHVDEGESHQAAAYRELEEELGVNGVVLELVKTYKTDSKYDKKIIRRFNSVYKTIYDGEFVLQKEEVEAIKWFSKKELQEAIKVDPNKFTPGFRGLVSI